MDIRYQLALSIVATGVLLAFSGFLLSQQISEVALSFDVVQNKATPSIIALGDIKSDFNALHAAVLAFNLHVPEAAGDPEIKLLALDHLDEVYIQRQRLLDDLNRYTALTQNGTADEISNRVVMLNEHISEMIIIGNKVMNAESDAGSTSGHSHGSQAVTGGGTEIPPVLLLHEMILEFNEQAIAFNEELDGQITENYALLGATQNEVLTDIGRGANLNVLLTAAILAVTGGVGGVVAVSISRRVVQLKRTAGEIARGNLHQQIPTTGADEISDLAKSFEQMRKSLVQAQEELQGRNMELSELNFALERANEELKQLDRMKDEFIGVASHELRSPIHPILGYASMAKEGMISEKEALDVIYKQAKRLKQLASDILDVSRIESGSLPYSMKEINLYEILSNCIEAITPSVSSEVRVVTDLEEQGFAIIGDHERLSQVFTNLLGNALKFTKKGKISVKTHLVSPDRVAVMISDTGGGIPNEIIPRLFNKFVTRKVGDDEVHGTGLGLFISKSIVEAHGGRISAYNNETGGATFKVELPLKTEEQVEKHPPIAPKF